MIWTVPGTAAFGFLILFEYRKCRSTEKIKTRNNPWFLVGTVLLLTAFAGMAVTLTASPGLQRTGGITVLGTGLILYILVLTGGPKKEGYVREPEGNLRKNPTPGCLVFSDLQSGIRDNLSGWHGKCIVACPDEPSLHLDPGQMVFPGIFTGIREI